MHIINFQRSHSAIIEKKKLLAAPLKFHNRYRVAINQDFSLLFFQKRLCRQRKFFVCFHMPTSKTCSPSTLCASPGKAHPTYVSVRYPMKYLQGTNNYFSIFLTTRYNSFLPPCALSWSWDSIRYFMRVDRFPLFASPCCPRKW